MPSKARVIVLTKRSSALPTRRSSSTASRKPTPASALLRASGGSDVFLKSIGKEIGKGALGALGGFAISSITSAIFGDPGEEKLAEIGRQLGQISQQLARIEASLKEVVAVTKEMLRTLEKILEGQQKQRLVDLQDIVVRINTYHDQLAEAAANIDGQGKSKVKREVLLENLRHLVADMKSSAGRPSLREEFNKIDAILHGTAEVAGMVDVVIEALRADVRRGTLTLANAFDRLENFVRWAAWAQHKALRLLVNIEVAERQDPGTPTAAETNLLAEMTGRLNRVSERVVAFAETMADERDQKNEFFGGLERTIIHREPSRGTWQQHPSSIMARADRLRETLLGRTNVVIRLIPHLPSNPSVHRRGSAGHDPNLPGILLAGYYGGAVPLPTMRVVIGGGELTVEPLNKVWRGVASNGFDCQNPPLTHGLYFFVYEFDVDDRLRSDDAIAFEAGLSAVSEAALPSYQYSALDRQTLPALPPLAGKVSREGGASLTAMTYATVSDGAAAPVPRFRVVNMEFPNMALVADAGKKRAKMAPIDTNDANQLWMMEPLQSAMGVQFVLINVGTGLCCYNRPGNQNPIELAETWEVSKLDRQAKWVLGDVHATGEHYPIKCLGDIGQHLSALVSDTPPPKQRRRRRLFRLGTDEVRTIGSDVLGPGGHLFWKLDVLRGSGVKPWERLTT